MLTKLNTKYQLLNDTIKNAKKFRVRLNEIINFRTSLAAQSDDGLLILMTGQVYILRP